MRIDAHVEEKVRDTLHWAVKQEPAEFDSALAKFTDDAARLASLELLAQICRYVSAQAFGHVPSHQELDALAAEVATNEQWAALSASEVATFLKAVVHGQPPAGQLTTSGYVVMSFVVAASLLSSQPKTEGEWWFDYLDRVEAALEASA
ncbi:hypothetical protein ACLQ24_14805 [Micromonospora sp. DT4]|uniref:hypothetical protein n=1 Tax=Micromonospora sp. DT4 TaxID=3393438 RepID=UPI003CEFE57F